MSRGPGLSRLAWRYWLATECEQDPAYFDGAGELLDSWRAFAKRRGAEAGSPSGVRCGHGGPGVHHRSPARRAQPHPMGSPAEAPDAC